MKLKSILLFLSVWWTLQGTAQVVPMQSLEFGLKHRNVIPQVNTEEHTAEARIQKTFSTPLTLSYDKKVGERAKKAYEQWLSDINNKVFAQKGVKKEKAKKATLVVAYNAQIPHEGYRLSTVGNNIKIEASEGAGAFYGLQTLQQLLHRIKKGDRTVVFSLYQHEVKDAPRFGWRGFMLDEGRHFFGKDEVKRVLDIMARYKMNRFHWHLTEDQGWRIESKKYPLLTKIGAFRVSRTLPWGGVPADTMHYGGYYTQNDIREIVDYAHDRFIEIVPEIDMPGHFQAAVAAYPQLLACDPEQPHQVWVGQGISTDVMNVASPKALQFTKDLIDELIQLFPFRYIHLGGDECPTDKWQKNKACQDLLKKLGSTNYHDLQTHFYQQINQYVQNKPGKKRRQLIFWNEVLHGNTDSLNNITIMAWIGAERAAEEAAKRGFNCILTPQIPYYINRKQSNDAAEPRSQGNGNETLQRVYNYRPLDKASALLKKHCLGVQANFWTEWVETNKHLEYLMLPRLAAVAEAAWTLPQYRHLDNFVNKVRQQEVRYYFESGYKFGGKNIGLPAGYLEYYDGERSNK